MKHHDAETDEFIQQFNDFSHQRQNIVAELITRNNRLLLNIPGYGPARRISAHLQKGPFSGFYEFEKTLARALHPIMTGLNLNIISDILINSLFTEKYHFYARDINFILAANKKLSLDILKKVILGMVEKDGHYMVVKFYDLVVRVIDADLFRALKPVELCLIDMKKNLGAGDSENTGKILKIYRRFRKTHGYPAARFLLKRMEWDTELVTYIPRPEEDLDSIGVSEQMMTGTPSEEAKPITEPEQEGRVAQYARLIKVGYLQKKDPDDEIGIRSIVDGMFIKNDKVSGEDKAAAIVRDVLAIWIDDDSLDGRTRRILANIRDERQGRPAPEEEYAREAVAAPDIPDDGAVQHTPAISGEEPREQGDEEKFLISDDEISELAEARRSSDEDEINSSFLISDEEMTGEVSDEVTEEVSADQTFIEDLIAADEFAVQDEILYEDKNLKKKYQKDGKKPGDKH